jgi:diguanylate cyclase (GGDEF)-like protein
MAPAISLKTLLSALLALVFLLLGGALFLANLTSTRDFMQRQLGSHAQDAATTLSLHLAPALAADNLAAITSNVDALFDSGYYRHIRIARPGGKTLIEQSLPVRIEGVPDWFVHTLPLDTPSGQAEAMHGWKRTATIEVASDPGFAYRQLWIVARDTLLLTLGFWLLSALLATWLVTRALRSLHAMERLALAVGRGEFNSLTSPPRVRELRHIGEAVNSMSASVRRMLDDKSSLIEKLQADLYSDPQTGLANRTYFLASLVDTLREHGDTCGLILVMVDGLGAYNGRQGRAAGDQMIAAVAKSLYTTVHAAAEHPASEHVARIDGTQFAVLLELTDAAQLREHAEQLAHQAEQTLRRFDPENHCRVHAGAALAERGDSSTLLAKADAALRDARLGDSGTSRQAASHTPGAQDLRQLLRDALNNANLSIEWQPVTDCQDDKLVQFEAYARLYTADGQTIPAGAFVHLAEESGLVTALDRLILSASWGAEITPPGTPRTVNLSIASLLDDEFVTWMKNQVRAPGKMYLELGSSSLASASPRVHAALTELRQAGFGLILDRFIPLPASLAWLHSLRPDWVKVEGTLCRQARVEAGTRTLLKTLCDYSHELRCQVAATGIEEMDELQVLCELGFDAAQGRLFNQRG